MKQKDLCDYDPICIMSNSLMFDDITMNIISNNEFPHTTEENDCLFTQIDNIIIYMYKGSLQDFYYKKELMSVYKFHVYISIKKIMI